VPKSSDFSSAEWSVSNLTKVSTAIVDPLGGTAGCELSSAGALLDHYITGGSVTSVSYTSGTNNCFSCYAKAGSITKIQLTHTTSAFGSSQYANFDLEAGTVITSTGCTPYVVNIGGGWFRLMIVATATTTANGGSGAVSALVTGNEGRLPTTAASGNFYLALPQNENVSGQADQTASEYVSVGVLSSPYHGAGTVSGADGCKWFPTNKDGSAISSSTSEGYFAEPSRTNNCLWNRDLTKVAWTNTNITAAKTATGIDNVSNSATRLTAAATDATITQLLTAATGTRTLSAYIKRISGSGTISLTRNGGTNWTDITSSLVTGSWVLVQMTSDVGANPTVGIKMGTSGDVIDVDCMQDENGAWATSPILTTTAAVTRNGDVLSYASAFDVTQGTALCSLKSNVPVSTSNAVALAGDANARLMYFTSATARNSGAAWDATNTATATGLDVTTGVRKRASRWGTDLMFCSDGVLGTATAFDGSMGASTTLYVGCNQGGTEQLSGTIREVHIWPTPLTDTQLKQVTS
jgi:hypothetical protein